MNWCWAEANSAVCFAHWLHDWQTLISGALALLAAALTIRVLRRQINQATQQYNDAIARRNLAARAGMAVALSEIANVCQEAMLNIFDRLVAEQDQHRESGGTGSEFALQIDGRFRALEYPTSAATNLRTVIEAVPKPEQARHIGFLLAELQVAFAQYHNFSLVDVFPSGTRRNAMGVDALIAIIARFGVVLAMLNILWDYGRMLNDSFEPIDRDGDPGAAWQMVQAALQPLHAERPAANAAHTALTDWFGEQTRGEGDGHIASPWLHRMNGL